MERTTKRDFLKRIALLGATTIGGSTLLAACGGSSDAGSDAPSPAASAEASNASNDTTGLTEDAPSPAASAEASNACNDTTGLTETDLQMRTSVQYVAETPEAAKNCANCLQYIAPAAGSACGGCKLFKGPVAANGYCMVWAAQVS